MAWSVEPVSDGTFRLDGGTMFGIVPKALWSRWSPPDDLNRIALALTCYLLRDGRHTVLLEAGTGAASPQFQRIYALKAGAPRLPDRLRGLGVAPEEVDLVLLSHLHLDHAGWCTQPQGDAFVPTFPREEYVVQRGEYEAAASPGPLERGSYAARHIEPVTRAGQWRFLEGDTEILPGLRAMVTGGHTAHHQVFLVESADGVCCFPADLVPTVHHLRLSCGMAYDLFPLDVAARKADLLRRAAAEGWRLLWYHDPQWKVSRVERDGKNGYRAVPPAG